MVSTATTLPCKVKLVPWNAEQAHCRETFGFTKAQVLLTTQKTIMNLLTKCVKGLLAAATAIAKLRMHLGWDYTFASNFSRFGTSFPWSTDFAKPFSKSPRFDARKISELVTIHRRVVLDALDLLHGPRSSRKLESARD